MSVDTKRIEDLMPYLHMLWSSPFQIVIALGFLYKLLGLSIFVGVLIILLLIPINALISRRIRLYQQNLLKRNDARMKLINELLFGIKVIKCFSWEDNFISKIQSVRYKELKNLRYILLLQQLPTLILRTCPAIISTLTLITYACLGNKLTPDVVFTSISLFSLIRFPAAMFPMVLLNLVGASVSVDRILKFLCAEEVDLNFVIRLDASGSEPFLSIENGSFSWVTEKQKRVNDASQVTDGNIPSSPVMELQLIPPTLKDINFNAQTGELVAIIGRIATGKSSLVSAFLGEIPKSKGTVTVCGSISYVSQLPWIQSLTVRQNVTFGLPFECQKYSRVIKACCLEDDIFLLPNRDMTDVGEKGTTLSGGQKQRLSLARAIYTDSDIYFFDNTLSAVDSYVSRKIFNRVIGPNGLLKDKLRIFVTNTGQYLSYCDKIYLIADGGIVMQGSYEEMTKNDQKSSHLFARFLSEIQIPLEDKNKWDKDTVHSQDESGSGVEDVQLIDRQNVNGTDDKIETEQVGFDDLPPHVFDFEKNPAGLFISKSNDDLRSDLENKDLWIHGDLSEDKKMNQEEKKLISKEKKATGKVSWVVYLLYFKSIGYLCAGLTIVVLCFQSCLATFAQFWLATVTSSQSVSGTTTLGYLGIYCGIYSLATIFGSSRSILLFIGSIRSSIRLHRELLLRVIRCPMRFFETIPVGRILNRFSKDIYTIDAVLSLDIDSFCEILSANVSVLITVIIPFPIILVLLVFIFFC